MKQGSHLQLRSVWPVGSPHTVQQRTFAFPGHKARRHDVLIPSGNSDRELKPDDLPKLLNALVELAQEKRASFAQTAAQFADTFGFMGYNQLVREENRCPGQRGWRGARSGEPLEWLAAHARTLYQCAILTDLASRAVKDSDVRKELKKHLENFPVGPYGERGAVRQLLYIDVSDPIDAANDIVRELLGPNLGSVNREVLVNIFTCETPLQAAYWQLADQIGKGTVQRCMECGRVFLHDRKVKFCLPVPPKTISPCKSRFNVRAMRRREKRKTQRRRR